MQFLKRIQIKLGLKITETGGTWGLKEERKGRSQSKRRGQSFCPTGNTRVGMKEKLKI